MLQIHNHERSISLYKICVESLYLIILRIIVKKSFEKSEFNFAKTILPHIVQIQDLNFRRITKS